MRRFSRLSTWTLLTAWACAALGWAAPAPGAAFEPPAKLELQSAQAETPPPSGGSHAVLALSIRECIALALKNNLAIHVEGFNPLIREQDVTGEQAVFDPSAFLEVGRTDARLPTASAYINSFAKFDLWELNTGLRQKLPTGGTYELHFNNARLNTTGTSRDGYSSQVVVSLTQPLLKNFGLEANETGIKIAAINRAISQEQLRLRVSDIATQVHAAYHELLFAIENLAVQRRSLRLAQALVALNQARARAGVAARVEVTQAEAQEAARKQDVIQAEKSVYDAEDTLKILLNVPGECSWAVHVEPTEMPAVEVAPLNVEESIRTALANRYEYKHAKLDIETKELSVRLTRSQLLPDLALTGSVSTDGFHTAYGPNVGDLTTTRFVSYAVGAVLTVPLGNRAAQASHARAKLAADQARVSLKQMKFQIIQQVREAVRRVEADAQRVDANRVALVLAEEQLRVEQRRLEAGVTTTFNVLSFQRDLAAAQANAIRAITDYHKSVANLESVQGTVLARNRIEM